MAALPQVILNPAEVERLFRVRIVQDLCIEGVGAEDFNKKLSGIKRAYRSTYKWEQADFQLKKIEQKVIPIAGDCVLKLKYSITQKEPTAHEQRRFAVVDDHMAKHKQAQIKEKAARALMKDLNSSCGVSFRYITPLNVQIIESYSS